MRYLWLAGSHQVAAPLMGAVGLAALLGGTLPQSARLSPEERQGWETEWSVASSWLDSLQLSDVFGSKWFAGLVGLLFANLAIGTALCIYSRWRRWHGRTFRECGPRPLKFTQLIAVPLLHLGLLVIIAGGWWSGAEGFGAHLELTRGEIFAGDPKKFIITRGSPGAFPGRLRLDDAHVALNEAGRIQEMKAALTYRVGTSAPRRTEARANQPFEFENYRLTPNNSFGYTAVLERQLPDGERRLMLVNFKAERSDWGKNREFARQTRLELPHSAPIFLRMRLSGPEFPLFTVQAKEGLDAKLRPGEEIELDHFVLRFHGIAPWMGFYVTRDTGQGIVFSGIVLMISGFFLHLTLPYHRRLPVATQASTGKAYKGQPGMEEVVRC